MQPLDMRYPLIEVLNTFSKAPEAHDVFDVEI